MTPSRLIESKEGGDDLAAGNAIVGALKSRRQLSQTDDVDAEVQDESFTQTVIKSKPPTRGALTVRHTKEIFSKAAAQKLF